MISKTMNKQKKLPTSHIVYCKQARTETKSEPTVELGELNKWNHAAIATLLENTNQAENDEPDMYVFDNENRKVYL